MDMQFEKIYEQFFKDVVELYDYSVLSCFYKSGMIKFFK